MTQKVEVTNKTFWEVIAVLSPIGILCVGIIFPGLGLPNLLNWFIITICMIGFLMAIGKLTTNRKSGILINERYYMTLSRFQLVIWTVIVLSAFLTIALGRVYALLTDPSLTVTEFFPLSIGLPPQLWALLGISTTSLVGSPLILNTKKEKTPNDAYFLEEKDNYIKDKIEKNREYITANKEISRLRQISTTPPADIEKAEQERDAIRKKLYQRFEPDAIRDIDAKFKTFGFLAFKRTFNDAEFADMFKGDEQGNKKHIDMAKVQMFFFTIIIVFTYLMILLTLIYTTVPKDINSFPALDDGLVALLGISSAGFLGNKISDHTKT